MPEGIEIDRQSLKETLKNVKVTFAAMLGFESGEVCAGS